jgi:predicted nucleotidyltransferase
MFEQERVLVRLQQYVLGDKAICACFLSGSFGRGEQDAFSDLDVILVYEDEERRELAFASRRRIVQAVMPYVPSKSFDADHVRPFLHAAVYSNGSKVDFSFEAKGSLMPSADKRDLRLLKDSDRWGEQFLTASAISEQVTPRPAMTREQLLRLDNRFWVMFMDIFRLLKRGDYEKAFPVYLQLLYFTLPPLLAVLPPGDPAVRQLTIAHFNSNPLANSAALKRLLEAYLHARATVVRRQHLDYTPDRAFESGILRLVAQRA